MAAAAPAIPQLFGIVPTGSPLLITPTSAPSPTSYVYTITIPPAPAKPFTHLTIFLLPGVVLPPATAAAVYLALPQSPTNFRFLGAIGESKESAVFKISGLDIGNEKISAVTPTGASHSGIDGLPDVSMDAPEIGIASGSAREIIVGISIESVEAIAIQIANLQAASVTNQSLPSSTSNEPRPQTTPNTLHLAQRIIKDAFNFLASHSSSTGAEELVPLKAFEEWWRKFETKMKRDPEFLEKNQD
ncbi:hypothetical protein K3495_g2177 [Podosphaera aphanis]|nr:hypothetical protein K3495_g2177 [Podosphaera aphanis]